VRAEDLPPVTADGRMWDPTDATPRPIPGTLDLDFARAAVALEHPGDQSGIVKTAFGYHVIRLEERYPAVAPSFAERRALLEQDIITRRGKRELETLKTRLRAQTTISIERAAEALTGLVAVEP
jgi:parvulin-like peptidyl-prolyl isomerase